MKKYLLRIIVFAVTFAVGVGLIKFFASNEKFEVIAVHPLPTIESIVVTSPNGKVEVYFKEFITTEEGLAMKFEIFNKNTERQIPKNGNTYVLHKNGWERAKRSMVLRKWFR